MDQVLDHPFLGARVRLIPYSEQVLDILYEGQDGLTRVGHCLTQGESGVRHIESGVRHIDLW